MTPDREHPLTIDARSDGDGVELVLTGELDPHTAPLLQQHLDGLAATQRRGEVVLDLAGLTFVDSSGLRVMIGAQRDLAGDGGRLVIGRPSDTTRRLLEITGLLDHLEVRA